jgi:hypothetical protein
MKTQVGHIVAGRAPGGQAQNGVSHKQASNDANRQLTLRHILVLLQLNGLCRDEYTLSLIQLP